MDKNNNNMDTFKTADFHGGGRGDTHSTGRDKSKYVTRKFCNGVKVPVFLAESDDEEKNPLGWYWSPAEGLKSRKGQMSDLNHYESSESHGISLGQIINPCTCPICWELMIEATSTSCGHFFCSLCLKEWLKLKPICPVCSKEVTSQIRLYSIDQLIELLLQTKNVPPELRRRYHEAAKARMDKQGKDQSSRGFIKKLRQRLDDLLISCKSKGVLGTLKNSSIVSMPAKLRNSLSSPEPNATFGSWFNDRKVILYCGIIIGALGAIAIFNLWNSSNFFQYIYLSIKNYDGSIPAHLLDRTQPLTETGQKISETKPIISSSWWGGNEIEATTRASSNYNNSGQEIGKTSSPKYFYHYFNVFQ